MPAMHMTSINQAAGTVVGTAAGPHRWFAPRDTLDTVAADTLTGCIATGVRVLRR